MIPEGVFILDDAFVFGLTSKIPPLRSMLNFAADVKMTPARHQREKRKIVWVERRGALFTQNNGYVLFGHVSTRENSDARPWIPLSREHQVETPF